MMTIGLTCMSKPKKNSVRVFAERQVQAGVSCLVLSKLLGSF